MSVRSSIYESAYQGDYDSIKAKIDTEPKLIDKIDSNGRMLIHWAALSGNVKLVAYLLDHRSPIDPPDDTQTTPLILAASAGKLEVCKALIARGAEVNFQSYHGHSALQYACSKGWEEVAAVLIQNGADVNICDIQGATPLHRGSSKGNANIVRLLLTHADVQVNLRDHSGNTPLHLACEEDRQEEAQLLVKHGAFIDTKNNDRQTPLDLCNLSLAKLIKKVFKSV